MIMLFLLPFYDRSPERRIERRPIALTAGLIVIATMAYLTYEGANAGPPGTIDMPTPASVIALGPKTVAEFNAGKAVAAQSGCQACHKIGEDGNSGPGPPLTHIGSRVFTRRRSSAPSSTRPRRCRPLQASLQVEVHCPRDLPVEPEIAGVTETPGTLEPGQVSDDVRPDRGSVRPDELGDDRRPAPSLALPRRRPRPDRPRQPRARRRHRDRRPRDRAGPPGRPRRVGRRLSTSPTGMLDRARAKAPGIAFEWGDALALSYADDEFDAATVGFGARNFADLDRGLAEMARVVRPGGRVVILEITTPTRPPLSNFFRDLVRPHRPRARPPGRRLRTPTTTSRARSSAFPPADALAVTSTGPACGTSATC